MQRSLAIALIILALVIGAAGGYLIGDHVGSTSPDEKAETMDMNGMNMDSMKQ